MTRVMAAALWHAYFNTADYLKGVHMIRKFISILSLFFFTTAFTAALGCAAHKTVSTTETVSDTTPATDDTAAYPDESARAQPEIVQKDTTTTTTNTETQHEGVFNIIADIIALPFRAVGALFTAIF